MAVVFISPKQRQKMFFLGITVVFLLFISIISISVFLSSPKEVSPVLVFNKPKVSINMSVFESDQFKNLVPFAEMQTQYSYKATGKDRRQKTGFIAASSVEDARKALSAMGLSNITIDEAKIGRDNPFSPYYGYKAATSSSQIK